MMAGYNNDSSNSRQDERSEGEDDDEEIAKLLAKAMKFHLPEIRKKQNALLIKHAEDIETPFKIKASDGADSAVQLAVLREKSHPKAGRHEEISWVPEVSLIPSTNESKCDSGKAGRQPGQDSDKHVEAIVWKHEKQLQDGLIVPPRDPKKLNRLARKQVKDTLGAKWFDMPAQTITPELKNDLQLLKLRSVIDPKRHYKAEDSKGLPKYFQVGTVIQPATEFYSQRLTKKERKPTIADELLSNSEFGQYRKRKYAEIQERHSYKKKGRKQKKTFKS